MVFGCRRAQTFFFFSFSHSQKFELLCAGTWKFSCYHSSMGCSQISPLPLSISLSLDYSVASLALTHRRRTKLRDSDADSRPHKTNTCPSRRPHHWAYHTLPLGRAALNQQGRTGPFRPVASSTSFICDCL